jgi:cell cycle checkpoint control protein RAD9A
MAILTFTLSPEAVGKLHDALVCLGKFSEAVSIDANRENVSWKMCIYPFVD